MRPAVYMVLCVLVFLSTVSIVASASLDCKNGSLNDSQCSITNEQNITGVTVDAEGVDIVVEDGGKLFTDHVTESNNPTARITITDGDFIVKSGGVVHSNIDLSVNNLIVEEGGVIDASGLGWQPPPYGTKNCPAGTSPDGYCLGRGPAGGAGGDGNSNTGAGGGGHGGKGGSFRSNSIGYDASGGGRGNINNETYGNRTDPNTFGSAGGGEGGSERDTISDVNGDTGIGNADLYDGSGDSYYPELVALIQKVTFGGGTKDDPDSDPADSDRWHPDNEEYRVDNPHSIYMGSGGGVVSAQAKKEIVINGTVLSNGLDAGGSNGQSFPNGAGAGGSISLSAGGLFGDGRVKADGGDYAEWLDGDDSNTGSGGVSSGGGGGRVYYAYSIKDENWSVTANRGYGNINVSSGFGKNTNKQDLRDVTSTDGTVESDILFTADVDKQIVNDDETIYVNGTASSNVSIYLNNSLVATADPNESDGFYEKNITSLNLSEFDQYEDYILNVSATISNITRQGTFNISHEAYEVVPTSDRILRPGQDFDVSVNVTHHLAGDDGDHSQNTDVSGQLVDYTRTDDSELRTTSAQTGPGGLVSFTDTADQTASKQEYYLETNDSRGINGSTTKEIAWLSLSENIVDPGEAVTLNGSIHDTARIYLENRSGGFDNIKNVSANTTTGYFNTSIQSRQIQEASNLGEYTLEVRTDLNGVTRTEQFQLNHRELEILNEPDFLLRPYETLRVSNKSILYKEQGPTNVTTEPFVGDITLSYKNNSGTKRVNNLETNQTGDYSFSTTVLPNREKKRYTLFANTSNGIDDAPSDDDIFSTNNQSYGWVSINDSIVDPEDNILVNGSAHRNVTIYLENQTGGFERKASANPDNQTGYYEKSISTLDIDRADNFGDYTLQVNTTLNDQVRTENFTLTHREIEISHNTDYLLRPQETINISADATLYKEDVSGGPTAVPHTNKRVQFNLKVGNETVTSEEPNTTENGRFSFTSTMPDSSQDTYYTLTERTNNGIDDTVEDDDLFNTERKNLSVVRVDQQVVNQGEPVTISGTAYNDIYLSLDGTPINGSPLEINGNESYTHTFNAPTISNTSDFGNQTLQVTTELNGELRTENFDLSIRGIRYNLSHSYPRNVDPGEPFTVEGTVTKFKDNQSGAVEPTPISGEDVSLTYKGPDGTFATETTTANQSGGFKFTDLRSAENAGDRTITLKTETSKGVSQTRSETVSTRIRIKNTSTTSPKLWQYKDHGRERTPYINPKQPVTVETSTRKSTDFVKSVQADITLPNGTTKKRELNVEEVLGRVFTSGTAWDQSTYQHAQHADLPGGLPSDQVRIGASNQLSDKLFHYEYEDTDGRIHDVAGNLDASNNGADRGIEGIFSSDGVGFAPGTADSIALDASPNVTGDFSFATWMKVNGSGRRTVYSHTNGGSGDQRKPEIYVDNEGSLNAQLRDSGNSVSVDSSPLDGGWNHMALVYNTTRLKLYVNGDQVDNASADVTLANIEADGNPSIGVTTLFGDLSFAGKMDETLMLNQSLRPEEVQTLSSTSASLLTEDITTEKAVKDILKLVDFDVTTNGQSITMSVKSDPNDDDAYEETSKPVSVSNVTNIRSVTGFENASQDFKVKVDLETTTPSKSPVLRKFSLQGRASDNLEWKTDINLSNLSNQQLGQYNATYRAEDYEGNQQDTTLEQSTFQVETLKVNTSHQKTISPGSNLTVNGTIRRDRHNNTGSIEAATGRISIQTPGLLKGDNTVEEHLVFENLNNGTNRTIPVDGILPPQNATVTFIGAYSGIDEAISWSTAQDWDESQTTTGISHSSKSDSDQVNDTLKIGFPTKDLRGDDLVSYYALDDENTPYDNSITGETLSTNSNITTVRGLLNSGAAYFDGSKKATSTDSFIDTSTDFTTSFWVYPTNIPSSEAQGQQTLLSLNNTLSVQLIDGGELYLQTETDEGTRNATVSTAIEQDKWSQITVRYDRSASSLTGFVGDGIGTQASLQSSIDGSAARWSIGGQTSSNQNNYTGRLDELRTYERLVSPFQLRRQIGSPTIETLQTGQKSFNESINPASLLLRSKHDLNGQSVNLSVIGENGGRSGSVVLEPQKQDYRIDTGSLTESQSFTINVSMTSNITHTPVIRNLTLLRRYASEAPEVDLDGDGSKEASVNSRIPRGQTVTTELTNLSTGRTDTTFLIENGVYDVGINYTEIIENRTAPPVNTTANGFFESSFTTPSTSGQYNITTFYTDSRGIHTSETTTFDLGLSFSNTTVQDATNGDRTAQPTDTLRLNTSIGPTQEPLSTVWVNLSTSTDAKARTNLTETEQYWVGSLNLSRYNTPNDKYNLTFFANDSDGLREVKTPIKKLNITTATVTSSLPDPSVGLERNFSVNGTVVQDRTDTEVNGTINVSLPSIGRSIQTTVSNGSYNVTLRAPSQPGNYTVMTKSTDTDGITSSNATNVEVLNTTSINVERPQSVLVEGVSTTNAVNKTIPLNITNQGRTEIRNVTVYGEALPQGGSVNILSDEDWQSINKTYNISANSTKTVDAIIRVAAGSRSGIDFTMNISTTFTTSAGETIQTTGETIARIKGTAQPVFQNDINNTFEDGYQGNLLPEDLKIVNEGSTNADQVSWSIPNDRIRSWVSSFLPEPGQVDLSPQQELRVSQMNGLIPEGTPPGNYSAAVPSTSSNPDRTNEANITLNVENSPNWDYSIASLDDEVTIPNNITYENPIDLGIVPLQSKGSRLELKLNNTGNRNLSLKVRSGQIDGDLERIISVNNSEDGKDPVQYRSETYEASIQKEENYTYSFDQKTAEIGYDTGKNLPETYRANVTILCESPAGCNPQEITLPLEATIKDPAPTVSQVSLPDIVGRNETFTISGNVYDETGFLNSTGVEGLNITVIKYIGPASVETLELGEDFDIEDNGDFAVNFTPTKEGRDLETTNDHTYRIGFETRDNNNNTRQTGYQNVTVRDTAETIELDLNRTSVTLDDVNATSGDTAQIRGTISGAEVPIDNLNVDFIFESDEMNYSNTDKNYGSLQPNQNQSLSNTIVSAANLPVINEYSGGIDVGWTNPDGTTETGIIDSIDVSISPNQIMGIQGPSTVNVSHNTTQPTNITIQSLGNTPLEDVSIRCEGCTSELGVQDVGADNFAVDNGNSKDITINFSADLYTNSTTLPVQIVANGTDTSAVLDGVELTVPSERAVSLTPRNITAFFPANQGELEIASVTAKNIGNTILSPLTIENPDRGVFYLGSSSTEPYNTTLTPGDTREIRVRADSDSTTPKGDEPYNETINPDTSTTLDNFEVTNLQLFVQNISFAVLQTNKTEDVVADDTIKARFNLSKEGTTVDNTSNVNLKAQVSGQTVPMTESFNNDTGIWTAKFNAPDLEDGVPHTFTYEATSDSFLSSVSVDETLQYLDVSPPTFHNLTTEPVEQGENTTVKLTVKDKSDLLGGVQVSVSKPEGESFINLADTSATNLSQVDAKEWVGTFTNTTAKGRYKVTATASDTKNNTGVSDPDYFRVFEPVRIEGNAGSPSPNTRIELVDAGGDVAETVTPNGTSYNTTIKSGTYAQAEIQIDNDRQATLTNISAQEINQSPPQFESSIPSDKIPVDQTYLKGFAVNADSLSGDSGSTSFRYNDVADQVSFQGNLQILKCSDYNSSAAAPCQSGYQALPQAQTAIDPQSQIVAAAGIEGFSSYILVENTSSSDDTSLNVNISGDIGNLGDLSGLQGLLSQVASNTEGLDGGSGGRGGGGGGGGGSESSSQSPDTSDALDDIASELNESESPELAVGNSEISVDIQPGETKSTAVSIQNPRDDQVTIQLTETENLEPLLSFNNTFDLSPGEFRTVRITVNASNRTELTEYSGFLQIDGASTDRSIPVNVNLITPDQRLLDVSLEPTVDSFKPGETARLKLSFSNQGFARAVDAETTVQIVDIADGDVVAKSTETYAVQTTLDRIVTLDIPQETSLGTYEARATVEYSNVPDNRSATAVGQVTIQKPFLERKTLGVSNSYVIISFLFLLIAGSAVGYWYYRKKKLEAKRSRFEEQVDNDAIPEEAGRTAFMGELSEIGTRAFLELDDLMTHCLTAGATGAGKSVAAQVIVEEALEQGVNVIVLDPTGQWSGYLDENENDEFMAFYEDFGMKEQDARSYEGNIRAVDADQDTIDITDVMRPEADEGSIHVFSMHKLGNADLEAYLSDTIQQIFDYNPEEKDHLETLIVYDEAHRVLEKFGGTGRGATMLERGAREFRKWGTGMLVISQVIEDFPEEVRANIGTQIQMRTEYEGDLDRIERKYGNNITQGVTKASTGTGMLQNSSYNHGRPYFIDFRPIKHSPERLSDTELDQFEKYNRRVDEIEDLIQILEGPDNDVFEYRSQLKLVKKNIKKRSFNLVDTYLDELEEDLEDAL